ncbi:uncharacterized protein LOC126844272 [Adelges cooleyi]|uniref:uncharacterized protein LOC126844272 n=1 Tax=Adelges cooleyi TaxID=133065 RepID=UPI00217FF0E1|nr:uncharacterized protein LOC126844272 [Adelges cooleyi]
MIYSSENKCKLKMARKNMFFFKLARMICYVLRICFNRDQAAAIIKELFLDLIEVLFGLELPFKCIPDNVLEKLLIDGYGHQIIKKYSLNIHKCIFISKTLFDEYKLKNMEWVMMNVKIKDSNKLPVLHLNRILVLCDLKENTCLLTSTNLFNIKNCDNSSCVEKLRLVVPLKIIKPKIAEEASIAVSKPFDFNDDTQTLLDKAFYNYFSHLKFVSVGDVFKIDLNQWYPESEYLIKPSRATSVFIKIVNLNGKSADDIVYKSRRSYYISNTQTKLVEVKCLDNTYLPRDMYYSPYDTTDINIDNFNNYLLDVLPDGMTIYGKVLESWIQPFISNNTVDFQSLKPFFLVYGNRGCGKDLLIESIARFMGVKYITQCCYDWPTNNVAQFKKKIEHFFESIRKNTPCLLHLENVEALCLSSTKDLELEVINILSKQIQIKTTKPIIIVGTTNSKEKLSPSFLRLFLQTQEIASLDKINCEKLLKWILKKESVVMDTRLINKIVDQTSGYNYSDYMTMLLIASKRKLSITDQPTSEINLTESDIMFAISKINAMFSKSIGAPSVQTVNWEDVGGLKSVKDDIMSALKPSTNNMRRSGLLLYGPPGTGKTLLAKAVATECHYNFLSVKGPELLNMYIGQSEANVREVFSKARSAAPCILFFDELDSLAPKRGQNGDSGGVGDRVVSQLLTEMDGVSTDNQQIFVLGATNRPDLIDSALLRPGRLDKSVYVGGCNDKESKVHVLKALTRKFVLSSDCCLEDIVKYLPPTITGAELYGICYNAWLNSAKRVIEEKSNSNDVTSKTKVNKVVVNKEDFMESLKNLSSC